MGLLHRTRRALLRGRWDKYGGSARYLLNDQFVDTRAAGAVNGTYPTPGPGGTRVVVDTDVDALSIGGGVVTFANSNANWGDPGIWYGPITRVAGRILMVQVILDATNTLKAFGWDVNQTGEIANVFEFRASGRIRMRNSGDAVGELIPYTATTYNLALVLRANGLHFFMKGGVYATWTRVWDGDVGATATLYPAIGTFNAPYSADNIRIPDILWSPTPLVSDSFDRANGAIGTSDGAGCEETAARLEAWTADVGAWTIAGNVAVGSTLAGGLAIATVETNTVNHITTATLARTGNELGIVLRYVDADNYIRAIHDGTNCKLIKRVATAETDVISAAVAIGAGEIRVVADGTAFSLYLNNAQVGATSTVADGALQTGTRAGLFSTNVANTYNDWYTFSRTGYNILDTW